MDGYVRTTIRELSRGDIAVSPIVSRSAENGETHRSRKMRQGSCRNGVTGAPHETEGWNPRFRRHAIGARHFVRRQQNMRWKVGHAALHLKPA
ncbi:hypothetical protein D3C80_748690 [compost metagenome]